MKNNNNNKNETLQLTAIKFSLDWSTKLLKLKTEIKM